MIKYQPDLPSHIESLYLIDGVSLGEESTLQINFETKKLALKGSIIDENPKKDDPDTSESKLPLILVVAGAALLLIILVFFIVRYQRSKRIK